MKLKKKIPFFICIFLLLVCVVTGVATRNSFTDVGSDPNLMSALYLHQGGSPETLNQSVDELKQQSELIAVITATGEREYRDNSFITKANIKTVFQGDTSMEGKEITIYEPVQADYVSLQMWNGQDALDFIKSEFPDVEKTETFISCMPKTAAMYQHAPLKEGKEYLVFLKVKEYPEISDKYMQTEEYNFIDSIYAIVDINPEEFITAPKNILLKDAMSYPVLLENQVDLQVYMEKYELIKDEFLKQ